jgi:predicted metal-dependent phosphoesterase TrpH
VLCITLLSSGAGGHTAEELKKEFGEVPTSLAEVTAMYERALATSNADPAEMDQAQKDLFKAQAGAIRAQIHDAQHEMIRDYKKAQLQAKCTELLEKIPAAERRVQKLEQAGKMQEVEQLQTWINKAKAAVAISCPGPGK